MLWRHEHPGAAAAGMPVRPVEPGAGVEARALDVDGRKWRHPLLGSPGPRAHARSRSRRHDAAAQSAAPPPPATATPGRRRGAAAVHVPVARDLAAGERRVVLRRRCRGQRAHALGTGACRRGTRLLLYLDGKLVEGATNSESFTLTNLERGVHSLAAVIPDERGNEKIRSEPRVFHIRQPTINPPAAVGPNLRPPAPPQVTVPANRAPRG